MSTFYLQSAQEQNSMFLPLDFEVNTLTEVPDYTAPITSQEGAIILNTELMASEGLPTPTSLKDLADPIYAGQVAVTDIQSSSTACCSSRPGGCLRGRRSSGGSVRNL